MCPANLIYEGKFGAEKPQKVEGKGNAFFKITFVLQGNYFWPWRYNRPNLLVGEHDLLLGNSRCVGVLVPEHKYRSTEKIKKK